MVSAELSEEMRCAFTIKIKWKEISKACLKFIYLQKAIFVNIKSFNLFPNATPSVCIFLNETW